MTWSTFQYRWIYHPIWHFGHFLQSRKWKHGRAWLEIEYFGNALKSFSWFLTSLNWFRFRMASETLSNARFNLKAALEFRRQRKTGVKEFYWKV